MELSNNTKIVRETYNEIASFFAPILSEENASQNEIDFMDKFLSKLPPHAIIADLGCGVGKHGRYCSSKGCSVTGYDVSDKMIELAKKNNDTYVMQVLKVADMCDISTDNKYDGIVAMYSFIHLTVEQLHITLRNLKNVMKNTSFLIMTVYYGDRDGYYDEALNPGLKQFFKDYTENEIKEILVSEGYTIVDTLLWNDGDEITASNDIEFGVIGLICSL